MRKIVLIDDDRDDAELFQEALFEIDPSVDFEHFEESKEALKILLQKQDHLPDLIFLDINMPAMNGWEFLDKYRSQSREAKRKIMIVMLTTSLFPEDKQRAGDVPEISAFENKPLTEEKLKIILGKYFEDDQTKKKTA